METIEQIALRIRKEMVLTFPNDPYEEKWTVEFSKRLLAEAAKQEPVALYKGMRQTPEGTREFFGYLKEGVVLTENEHLYTAPPIPADKVLVPVAVWPLMREYITAEIALSRVRNLKGKLDAGYEYLTTAQIAEVVSALEEQVTRMDTEIRALIAAAQEE